MCIPVRSEGVWVAPVAAEVVNEVHWDLNPCISPDRGSLQATVLYTHSRQSVLTDTECVTGVCSLSHVLYTAHTAMNVHVHDSTYVQSNVCSCLIPRLSLLLCH